MRDEANRQAVRIDAASVTAGREGVVLVLGTNHPPRPGETEATVQRPERIVLSPPSATRLSMALHDVLAGRGPETDRVDVDAQARQGHPTGGAAASDRPEEAIVGDETGMTTTYANTTGVTAGRDLIEIFFGVEQARQAGTQEIGIRLVRRVSLTLPVARQLAIGLDNALGNDRAELGGRGPAGGVSLPELGSRAQPLREKTPGSEEEIDRILLLFRQVGSLDALIDFEPSFKLIDSRLLENRFLLGTSRDATDGNWGDRIILICENIGMPDNLLAAFSQGLRDANHVYFGVEKNDRTLLFKAYLEFRDKAEKEIGKADAAAGSFPLFTGFKWDSGAPTRQAVSSYTWYPSLPLPEIRERLGTTFGASRRSELLEIVENIAKTASERISPSDIQFLEVTEEGNPRRSFDLNIYKSGLLLRDVHEDLLRALRYCAIPRGRFERLYQRIKAERIGHLAGGVDRDGRDFMTVYYGVRDIQSSQLATATIARRG